MLLGLLEQPTASRMPDKGGGDAFLLRVDLSEDSEGWSELVRPSAPRRAGSPRQPLPFTARLSKRAEGAKLVAPVAR